MIKRYIEAFFPAAKAAGIGRMRFQITQTGSRIVSVYRGEPEQVERSEESSLFIEGEVEGYSGSAFVGDFRPEGFQETIRQLRESALGRKNPFVPIQLPDLPEPEAAGGALLPLPELVERLKAAEQVAYEADKRVELVHSCSLSEHWGRVTLADDAGRSVSDSTGGGHFYISLTARQGGLVQQGEQSRCLLPGRYPDMNALARQAALDASMMLDASSYPTGRSPVVLDSRVVCELLDAFLPAFYGKSVQSRISVLAGKLGERIAGEMPVLEEDPYHPEGLCRRRFDDEGVLTTAKTILSGGILRTYLCDRQSAEWCGLPPGGNGFRPGCASEVCPGYTNLVFRAGTLSQDELLSAMGNGLLITGVNGVFAGANPASGDFSLLSQGYRVRDGKTGGGVNQITIAGNFFELLRQTEGIGSTGTWMRGGAGSLFAPSLYITSLAISGGGEQ